MNNPMETHFLLQSEMSDKLAILLGMDVDAVLMGLVLLSMFPVTVFYTYISNQLNLSPTARGILSTTLTFSIFSYNFSSAVLYHILLSTTYTYFSMEFLPTSRKLGSISVPWLVFSLNFLHLFSVQFLSKRFFTGAFMMSVIKNTMYAWDVSADDKLAVGADFLQYLNYMFYFPTFFVGPPFPYRVYGESFSTEDEKWRKDIQKAAGKSIAWSISTLVLYVYFGQCTYERVLESKENESFLHQFILLNAAGFISRMRYYAAWKMTEGCALWSGLGVELDVYGKDGEERLSEVKSGIRNVDILQIETSQNLRGFINSWNKMTAYWLKNYIYGNLLEPTVPIIIREKATLITFLASAAWHGIFPGYYLTFATGAMFTSVGRKLHKRMNPLYRKGPMLVKILYRLMAWASAWTAVNYLAGPFMLFSFKKGLELWSQFYFIYHIVGIVALVLL
jgi:lysophospholipid acyltransferase